MINLYRKDLFTFLKIFRTTYFTRITMSHTNIIVKNILYSKISTKYHNDMQNAAQKRRHSLKKHISLIKINS